MPQNKDRFLKAMSLGHTAAWDMEWEDAVGYYTQALEEFPDNLQALSNLGAAMLELGDYANALVQYQSIVESTPYDPLPLEKISKIHHLQGDLTTSADIATRAAELYLRNHDLDKAIENWTRAVEMVPNHIRARSRLALIYERIGRKPQAATAYLAVASLLQSQGNKDKAIELVEHALTLAPNNKEAENALGLLKTDRPLPTLRETKPLVAVQPAAVAPALTASSSAPKENKPKINPVKAAQKHALSELASLMFDHADTGTFQRESLRDRNLQDIEKDADPLTQVNVERTRIMLHLSQAVDLQSRGKYEPAAIELEHAINAGLNNPSAYFDLGALRAEGDRVGSAIRHLQQAVKHPLYALAGRILLGRTLVKLSRNHDAAIQYLEALKIADAGLFEGKQGDDLSQIYDPIIESFSNQNDNQVDEQLCTTIEDMLSKDSWQDELIQARQHLPKAAPGMPLMPLAELLIQAESSHVVEALSTIHQMARNGHLRMAMEEAFWAIQFAPTYLPLHTFMAELLQEQDHFGMAVEKFNVVARAYSSRGETQRAVDLYRRITTLAPLDLTARQELIEQLLAAGQFEETVQEYLHLGDVHYRLADLDQARAAYQKALSTTQHANLDTKWAVKVLQHLADIDMQRLDWRQALQLYEQAHGLDPTDGLSAKHVIELNLRFGNEDHAYAELGKYLGVSKQAGNTEAALTFLEDLVVNNPDHASLHKLLAEEYLNIGELQPAIEQWERAGELLLDQGDKAGTAEVLKRIIAMGPRDILKYQQALADLRK